jgi:hypothetical protein
MKWLLLISFILVFSCNRKPEETAVAVSKKNITITNADLDVNGQLSLHLKVNTDSLVTLYQWKGDLYPIFGRAVFLNIVEPNSKELTVERAIKVLPEAPYPSDTIRTKAYDYQRPLLLIVREKDGTPFHGCMKFSIEYDVNKFKVPAKHLSPIKLLSDTVEVCTEK